MNRLWQIGGVLVLAIAAVIGWLNAANQSRIESALVLADATTPGCDGVGQVHLVLGNAADRSMLTVQGVLSVAADGSVPPVPVGNFQVSGRIAPGQKTDACVALDEARLGGRERGGLLWFARATAVEFGE